jgi:hypothetical protein
MLIQQKGTARTGNFVYRFDMLPTFSIKPFDGPNPLKKENIEIKTDYIFNFSSSLENEQDFYTRRKNPHCRPNSASFH